MQRIESGIYAFVSSRSGFRYIGQSVNLRKRKREHLKDLRNDDHHAIHLQRHYNAHGAECIEYQVLEYCAIADLTSREQFWMNHFEPIGLFNSVPAADSAKGFSPTAETRLKLSIAGKGKKRSAETRALMSITNSRPVKPESIAKMIASRAASAPYRPKRVVSEKEKAALIARNKARVFTEECKAKIGAASKGRQFDEAARQKMRGAATGRKLTDDEKSKISAANKGRKRSQAVRDQMSLDRRGKKQTPEQIANAKAGKVRAKLAREARQI